MLVYEERGRTNNETLGQFLRNVRERSVEVGRSSKGALELAVVEGIVGEGKYWSEEMRNWRMERVVDVCARVDEVKLQVSEQRERVVYRAAPTRADF